MGIPTFFIVGAPRCGTTSLHTYLAAHPRIFVSEPKEPHYFGSDLGIRRPYADRRSYLELFNGAREDQLAGEASVLYLYSKTAPDEILEFSPAARIIIMVRDPVEMVCSLHAHNLFIGYENLPRLEDALAAEADRGSGRRLPRTCLVPLALQYRALGRYAEPVLRYQEVFGRDRVKCIVLDDLRSEPERVYGETLTFLGLESAALTFKPHNERLRWRSLRLGRAIAATQLLGYYLSGQVPARLRAPARAALGGLLYLPLKLNLHAKPPPPASKEVRDSLRQGFRDDVERLAGVLGRDLSSWLAPEPARLPAVG